MCRTFLDPKTCGFGKVAAIYAARKSRELKCGINEGKAKSGARIKHKQYMILKDIFHPRADFVIEFEYFNLKFKALQEVIQKWKKSKKRNDTLKGFRLMIG